MSRSRSGSRALRTEDPRSLDDRIARVLHRRSGLSGARRRRQPSVPTPPLTSTPLPSSAEADLEDTTVVELPWLEAKPDRTKVARRPRVIAGAATVAAAALLGGLVVGWPGLALFNSPPSEVPVEALPISDIEPEVAQPEPVLPDKPAEVPAVRRPEPRPIVADPIVAVRQVIPGPGRAKGHDKGKGNGHDKDKKGGQDGHGGRGRGDEDNSGPGGGKD